MYQVRPLVQQFPIKGGRDLTQAYFRQLTDQYERERGPLKGLYYEPRGTLYEPHSGRKLELGTREVYHYQLPEYQFNKILYVEKQGLWPVLEASLLGKRYDMGIIAGAGEPDVACRDLLALAEKGNYRLFVLHDADPGGWVL